MHIIRILFCQHQVYVYITSVYNIIIIITCNTRARTFGLLSKQYIILFQNEGGPSRKSIIRALEYSLQIIQRRISFYTI